MPSYVEQSCSPPAKNSTSLEHGCVGVQRAASTCQRQAHGSGMPSMFRQAATVALPLAGGAARSAPLPRSLAPPLRDEQPTARTSIAITAARTSVLVVVGAG